MPGISRKHSHLVFGVLQSGLTCLIASGIASYPSVSHWLASWIVSWVTMLPVVVLAAPLIRRLSFALTVEREPST